jgi:hypothetical protein
MSGQGAETHGPQQPCEALLPQFPATSSSQESCCLVAGASWPFQMLQGSVGSQGGLPGSGSSLDCPTRWGNDNSLKTRWWLHPDTHSLGEEE